MKLHKFFILLLGVVSPVFSGLAKNDAVEEMETVMMNRGKEYFFDTFDDKKFFGKGKRWRPGPGAWSIDKDALKAQEKAANKHAAFCLNMFEYQNFVLQFSFKSEGMRYMAVGGRTMRDDGKPEHIWRIQMKKDALVFGRLQGGFKRPGGFKMTEIGRLDHNFKQGAWYTVLVEMHGDKMAVQLQGVDKIGFGKDKKGELDVVKDGMNLVGRGIDGWAWFDNIRAWEAELKPDFNERKLKR